MKKLAESVKHIKNFRVGHLLSSIVEEDKLRPLRNTSEWKQMNTVSLGQKWSVACGHVLKINWSNTSEQKSWLVGNMAVMSAVSGPLMA